MVDIDMSRVSIVAVHTLVARNLLDGMRDCAAGHLRTRTVRDASCK